METIRVKLTQNDKLLHAEMIPVDALESPEAVFVWTYPAHDLGYHIEGLFCEMPRESAELYVAEHQKMLVQMLRQQVILFIASAQGSWYVLGVIVDPTGLHQQDHLSQALRHRLEEIGAWLNPLVGSDPNGLILYELVAKDEAEARRVIAATLDSFEVLRFALKPRPHDLPL